MPQNYAGRVTLIVVVLLIGLFGIPYLTGGVFSLRPVSSEPAEKTKDRDLITLNLKPGIDIAGGTSLLYEIKPPPGGLSSSSGSLAEEVAKLLKKRIDPTGTRNLIWRPTGNTRLEIQIPRASLKHGEVSTAELQKQYQTLKAAIEGTNITTTAVINAVETMTGPERDKALENLAHGMKARQDLFKKLVTESDRLKAIEAQRVELRKAENTDANKAKFDQLVQEKVEVQKQFDANKAAIEATNLSIDELQSLATAAGPTPPPAPTAAGQPAPAVDPAAEKAKQDAAAKSLADLAARFPEHKATIEKFAQVYPKFVAARGSIDDAADLKRQLRGSGVLEFHIMVDNPASEQPEMLHRLQPGGDGPSPQAGDQSRWFEVDRGDEFKGSSMKWHDKAYALAWVTPERSMTHTAASGRDWGLEVVRKTHDQNGHALVAFTFDPVGGELFGRLTGANINRKLATILDNKIITAPNIQSQINTNGQITLSGDDAEIEGNYISSTLSAGSLPAQLADEPISERAVGPQLGAKNLEAGLRACALGLVVVAIFMIVYYHLSGLVAFIAVVLNLVIILGVLGMMGATFTLPGIAALVLTIGMSVDANVLIFERLREEQMRGLTLKLALAKAYAKAFTAILDSNVTTAITSAFLIAFGSEEVKGFGLTLLIGIGASMFCALFVTKTIFGIMIEHYGLRKLGSLPLSFPKWNKIMHPHIDWMGKVKYFVAFSITFLALGIFAFVQQTNAGKMLDVEFTHGTSVVVRTKVPVTDDEIRHRIDAVADRIPQPTIGGSGDESGGGKYTSFEIVTANDKRKEVTDAIAQALADLLDVAVPSRFANDGASVADAAKAGAILPVTPVKNRFLVKGVEVPDVSTYSGGVAIVLEDLNPPLTPEQIADRVNSVVVRLGPESALQTPRVVRLDGSQSGQTPTRSAVVLFVNPKFEYAKNPGDWREKFATAAWQAAQEGIGRPPTLERVSNFDAQIAGDTQKAALFATLGSIVMIMVWIWLRFGDHKYGTATVAAMIHDTVMVIGAIGVSHWFAGSLIGNVFGLEAFRVNMTLVAAILTVMGYSMVDTIVVFDRIRENRGKYGVITRQLLNDSINQTLSRTLLTAGTTMMTLFVMYVWGGPAIHGFTYVLLIGILIGTYSSIAIGAPILLIGNKTPAAGSRTPPTTKSSGAVTGVARV